jgi:chemotaxis protein methyltransferase CheR/two-component system CheB/CheR fusion protein
MKNKPKIITPKRSADSSKLKTAQKPMPIVGIGASAGGLEALEDFFSHVKTPSNMAFIVIQHLDPSRKGIMAELLDRCTEMKVTEAGNGMKVMPNCVYVIPPNRDLSILHGSLLLLEPLEPFEPRGLRLPINFFFQSLADDQRENAIGVILSGMGSDGTPGVRAIKAKGGLCLAQLPESAKFDSMPRNAIDTHLIDAIDRAEKLPTQITELLKHSRKAIKTDAKSIEKVNLASPFQKIIVALRDRTGNDFSLYKKNTLLRRIERRMTLHQLDNMELYARYLRENSQEQDLLFKELLIGVTNFFRDKEVWAQLKSIALPALLANYPKGKELRVWVTACSTGEEAYSLAMTIMDALEDIKPRGHFTLQIFATDLDHDAINIARQGIYPQSIETDVSSQQLSRYFFKDELGYRVTKQIRDMVIFAPQNIIMDPPFTKLDIITCRNLLIYFGPELQKRLIPLFHYALNSHGSLVLGSAESIGKFSELFSTLNENDRIFTRIDTPVQNNQINFPTRIFPVLSLIENEPERNRNMSADILNLQTHADHLVLKNYSPAAVLVNPAGDIIYINGRTGKYLEPSAGKANWNINVMVHEELQYHLNVAMKQAQTQTEPVTIPNLRVGSQHINLTVQAISKPKDLRGLLMIVFTDVPIPINASSGKQGEAETISQSELELKNARNEVQATRDQMQAAQEELRSTNEELQSTNEELQSTNEELTTSKEEMQSMNEELQTVNTELQSKVDDLSWVNNDMKNLLNSTEIATVFLDNGLCVRRFTNYATHLFKLLPGDVGRPLSDIATELDYASLQDDARTVLDTLVFVEKEITAQSERWFKVRIMPYRTQENVIDGVVITFTDISEAKLLESELRKIRPTK